MIDDNFEFVKEAIVDYCLRMSDEALRDLFRALVAKDFNLAKALVADGDVEGLVALACRDVKTRAVAAVEKNART